MKIGIFFVVIFVCEIIAFVANLHLRMRYLNMFQILILFLVKMII